VPKALHGTTHIIDYTFALANVVHDERLSRITFDQIHKVIKRVAIAKQTAREIEAGKKWRDYRKKSLEKTFMREAAEKTASAMVRWDFLKRPTPKERSGKEERWYFVRPELNVLGEKLSQKRLQEASLMIFDSILRSERDSAFTPALLIQIRDSKIKSQEQLLEYSLPSEGVIEETPGYLRNYLKVGQIDFSMITYWCQELSLLNVFNPKILDIKLPEQVYLTVWFASLSELSSFYDKVFAGDMRIRSFSDLNCAKLLEKIEAVRVENGRLTAMAGPRFEIRENRFIRTSIKDPYLSELILIGEKSRFRELVRKDLEEFVNIHLLSPRHISTEAFVDTLRKYYGTLKSKWRTPYVWIAPLRSLCSRALLTSDEDFDNMLTNFYKTNLDTVEFSKAATGIFRKRVRVFEKPFKLYGQPFRMIRLVE
jgi:hypothetical protein